MANITLKDIPEELRTKLKEEAAANGRSLNKEVLLRLKISIMQRPSKTVQEILAEADRMRRKSKGVWIDDAFLDSAKRDGRP